eukprot:Skav217840  [mRNA]  locus=scaffold889:649670:651263:- [translate_table: standard]
MPCTAFRADACLVYSASLVFKEVWRSSRVLIKSWTLDFSSLHIFCSSSSFTCIEETFSSKEEIFDFSSAC